MDSCHRNNAFGLWTFDRSLHPHSCFGMEALSTGHLDLSTPSVTSIWFGEPDPSWGSDSWARGHAILGKWVCFLHTSSPLASPWFSSLSQIFCLWILTLMVARLFGDSYRLCWISVWYSLTPSYLPQLWSHSSLSFPVLLIFFLSTTKRSRCRRSHRIVTT